MRRALLLPAVLAWRHHFLTYESDRALAYRLEGTIQNDARLAQRTILENDAISGQVIWLANTIKRHQNRCFPKS